MITSVSDILGHLAPDDLPAALCTVVATSGSTPRRTGAKMVVCVNGRTFGTIGGGNLEKQVIQDALRVIGSAKPGLFRHNLLHELDMCCGGTVQVYIEPVMKKPRLYIFGAGHTGKATAALAAATGFETVVIDDREEYAKSAAADNVHVMHIAFADALRMLTFDNYTYIAVMTYSHPLDREIVAHCITQPHAYLGMIGSKRKVEMTKKMFMDAGVADAEVLDAVDMPMGIDIGAEGPEEIAVSIVARLLMKRNLRK